MAKWVKFNAKMVNLKNEELEESLGIKIDAEDRFTPIMVDITKVSSYTALRDEDGEKVIDRTELFLDNGAFLIVEGSFYDIDKIIRKDNE